MTQQQAKKLLPVIKAFSKGIAIQYKDYANRWRTLHKGEDIFERLERLKEVV